MRYRVVGYYPIMFDNEACGPGEVPTVPMFPLLTLFRVNADCPFPGDQL